MASKLDKFVLPPAPQVPCTLLLACTNCVQLRIAACDLREHNMKATVAHEQRQALAVARVGVCKHMDTIDCPIQVHRQP